MKKSQIILLSLVLVTILVVLGCAAPAPSSSPSPSPAPAPTPQPAAKPISIKLAYSMPPTSPAGVAFEWWADEVEKRSDGKVVVDTYAGGSLVKSPEDVNALRDGITQVGFINLVAYSKNFPISNVFSLPNLNFPDTKAGWTAAIAAHRQLIAKYKTLQDEFAGMTNVFWFPLPSSMIASTKLVRAPSDLKGMKIGCSGVNTEIIEAAGGAAVYIVPPNMYDAIQKSTINGGVIGWNHVFAHKLQEVCTYYLEQYFGQEITTCFMMDKFFNSLPADVQKIIKDVNEEANVMAVDKMLALSDAGRKLAEDAKRTITKPTAAEAAQWEQVCKVATDEWLANAKSLGVTDAQQIMDDLKKLRDAAWK